MVSQHLQTRGGGSLCGLRCALYPGLLEPVAVGSHGGLHLLLPRPELGRSGLGRPRLWSAWPAGSAVGADRVKGSAVDDLLEGSGCGPALLSANRLSGCVAVLGRAAGDRVLVPLHIPGQAWSWSEPVLRGADGTGVSSRSVDVSEVGVSIIARALGNVLGVGALAVDAGAGADVEDSAERAAILSRHAADAEEVLATVSGVGGLVNTPGLESRGHWNSPPSSSTTTELVEHSGTWSAHLHPRDTES